MLQNIPQLKHTASGNFFLMAGPCIVESEQMCMDIAGTVKEITDRLQIPYIFKASFRKANRSRLDSFTGIGDIPSLEILRKVRQRYQLPIVTDIHESHEAALAADYVDVLQIPAFLCRQTELLVAAARTGKTVNVKKGQFLSPESMKFAIDKIRQSGNHQVMVTERGTMLGYSDLVVDMRGIPEMKKFDVPVVMDVTHSLQQPNQASGVTGGKPELISTIARAAMAAGADGIFIETHPNPAKALSDGANMLQLDLLEKLLVSLLKVQQAVR